jgi:hypothetical protein
MHRKYIEKLVIEMYRDEYIIYKTYPGKTFSSSRLIIHPFIHLPSSPQQSVQASGREHPVAA